MVPDENRHGFLSARTLNRHNFQASWNQACQSWPKSEERVHLWHVLKPTVMLKHTRGKDDTKILNCITFQRGFLQFVENRSYPIPDRQRIQTIFCDHRATFDPLDNPPKEGEKTFK
eukprot:6477047-Amphidinium_carterae.1